MGITVVGAKTGKIPIVYCMPIVEIKKDWSDEWTFSPELELINASAHASGSEVPVCEVRRRYGDKVKQPYEDAYETKPSLDLSGYWLRLSHIDDSGSPVLSFVGFIYNDNRNLTGNADKPAGKQSWVAHGGLRILQGIDVSRSYHLVNGKRKEIGWIPDMNQRDKRGLLVGNRSSIKDGDVYLYGGTDLWSHLDYLKYVVQAFIQQENGPIWTISGQTDILDNMKMTVPFPDSINTATLIRKLVPTECGIDFRIKPTEEGFEIVIFALIAEESSFGATTMPKNPNTVRIQKSDQIDMVEVHIVKTRDHCVDQLRILGKRIVVCFSQRKDNGSLGPKWNNALEAPYQSDSDELRKSDKYKSVYQQFGAPVDWDFQGGGLALQCGLDGKLVDSPGDFQTKLRRTLPWLPLREGFDYSVNPAVDNNLSGHEPEMRPPVAWIYDPERVDASDVEQPGYVQCDAHGMSVHVPHLDWGIFISATPNHLLALNHVSLDSDVDPRFDYDTLISTIAIECDQRLQVGQDLPDNLRSGNGLRMDIIDDNAELWVLAPNTVVGVNADGTLQNSGESFRILRNDADRLKLIMAGGIARYINDRVRCQIVFEGVLPWGDLVGSILTVVEDAGDTNNVGAPITSVTWPGGKNPKTIICTGYA